MNSRTRHHLGHVYTHTGVLLAFILGASSASSSQTGTERQPVVTTSSPELLFEINRGQFRESIDFAARGRGYSVLLGPLPTVELVRYDAPVSSVQGEPDGLPRRQAVPKSIARFRLDIAGADSGADATPLQRSQAFTHYLNGKSSDWRTDVPNYARVQYSDVLPKIDVQYYGRDGRLEYDFIVRPGGDPDSIQIKFDGTSGVRIDDNGDLVLDLDGTEIVQKAPLTYQVDEQGQRRQIASHYALDGETIGFRLGEWDTTRALIIDPVLEYSRYYGGSRVDQARAIEIDGAGNIYVVGLTNSAGLASAGAYSETGGTLRFDSEGIRFCPECTDADANGNVMRASIGVLPELFITKFSPDGQTVLWSTYFRNDSFGLGADSVGVSAGGEVAFGITDANDGFPLVNPTQSWSSSQQNGYVAKLNGDGNGLVFGTYLHLGTFATWIRGLDVSPSGEVAVSGLVVDGNNFPVVGGIPGQSCTMNVAQNEFTDGFVALFDPLGSLTFSSCLGGDIRDGSSFEALRGITIGVNGDLYVLGYSSMIDFPVVNPIQATKNVPGGREMTISQINPNTGELVFSTWFGPADGSLPPPASSFFTYFPLGIEVDSGDNIVVSGGLNLLTFPAVNAFQPNLSVPREAADFGDGSSFGISPTDVFVTKLHPTDGVVFSTYLGGSREENSFPNVTLDAEDNIYVATITASDDYPVLDPIQSSKSGLRSLALTRFSPAGAVTFSTYLGGSNDSIAASGGVAVNAAGQIVLAGSSRSLDFPIVGSGTTNAGRDDVTLAIIDQSGDADADGDQVPDVVDAFPTDATEWLDTDGDLTGDNADLDDDGDGEPDVTDRFPKDGTETADADGDGAGDNLDQFDTDPGNYFDLDDDGTSDFDDSDADGDGLDAPDDQIDYDATETTDSDSDGIGDNSDNDDDGDGLPDVLDFEPLNVQSPIGTFEGFNPLNTSLYLSPWPDNFSDVPGSDTYWTAAQDEAFRGNISFGSRNIGDNQVAAIRYVDNFAGGALKFYYKVDSQPGADLFTFRIDGSTELTASGDTQWQLFEASVTPGVHTLEWRYSKDASDSAGADAAWFDDLVFDRDGDGATDDVDNCIVVANSLQRDTDGDGFGNRCDADLNNDCTVNIADLGLFREVFFSADADADLNGDDVVNGVDLGIFRTLFFAPPGPSAAGICTVP